MGYDLGEICKRNVYSGYYFSRENWDVFLFVDVCEITQKTHWFALLINSVYAKILNKQKSDFKFSTYVYRIKNNWFLYKGEGRKEAALYSNFI